MSGYCVSAEGWGVSTRSDVPPVTRCASVRVVRAAGSQRMRKDARGTAANEGEEASYLLQDGGHVVLSERAQGLGPHVAQAGDRKQRGHGRLVVGGLDGGDDVVLALGPVDTDELTAATLQVTAERASALDGVFGVTYPLVGELDQADIGGHCPVPAFAWLRPIRDHAPCASQWSPLQAPMSSESQRRQALLEGCAWQRATCRNE